MRGATRISPSTTRRRKRFQSTRPMRGATQQIHRDPGHFRFQSTRPMRGATVRQMSISAKTTIFQSTRPMRGATNGDPLLGVWILISIHAPHAGRDHTTLVNGTAYTVFQSTRPMRGATCVAAVLRARVAISIHAPHAGRDSDFEVRHGGKSISIHAPHAGRDRQPCADQAAKDRFQSTRPMRGATRCCYPPSACCPHFNPRAPCGARQLPLYLP